MSEQNVEIAAALNNLNTTLGAIPNAVDKLKEQIVVILKANNTSTLKELLEKSNKQLIDSLESNKEKKDIRVFSPEFFTDIYKKLGLLKDKDSEKDGLPTERERYFKLDREGQKVNLLGINEPTLQKLSFTLKKSFKEALQEFLDDNPNAFCCEQEPSIERNRRKTPEPKPVPPEKEIPKELLPAAENKPASVPLTQSLVALSNAADIAKDLSEDTNLNLIAVPKEETTPVVREEALKPPPAEVPEPLVVPNPEQPEIVLKAEQLVEDKPKVSTQSEALPLVEVPAPAELEISSTSVSVPVPDLKPEVLPEPPPQKVPEEPVVVAAEAPVVTAQQATQNAVSLAEQQQAVKEMEELAAKRFNLAARAFNAEDELYTAQLRAEANKTEIPATVTAEPVRPAPLQQQQDVFDYGLAAPAGTGAPGAAPLDQTTKFGSQEETYNTLKRMESLIAADRPLQDNTGLFFLPGIAAKVGAGGQALTKEGLNNTLQALRAAGIIGSAALPLAAETAKIKPPLDMPGKPLEPMSASEMTEGMFSTASNTTTAPAVNIRSINTSNLLDVANSTPSQENDSAKIAESLLEFSAKLEELLKSTPSLDANRESAVFSNINNNKSSITNFNSYMGAGDEINSSRLQTEQKLFKYRLQY